MGRLIALASIPLRLVPPAPGQTTKELVFRTTPSVTKVEVRRYLEALYGLRVERVATANYEGKKKRAGLYGFMRRPDWKKVWVTLREPVTLPPEAFVGPTKEAQGQAQAKE